MIQVKHCRRTSKIGLVHYPAQSKTFSTKEGSGSGKRRLRRTTTARSRLRRGKECDDQSCLRKGIGGGIGAVLSPSLDLDGTMLADASVEDVAKALEKRGIII
jgi:hypothetical protein